MAAKVITQDQIPRIKLYATSNATFRKQLPISVDGAVPTDLASYVWKATFRDGKEADAAVLFSLTCTANATGVLLSASETHLDALFTAPNNTLEKRTVYGNLLYNQPGLAGVYVTAALLEMDVRFGATEWT